MLDKFNLTNLKKSDDVEQIFDFTIENLDITTNIKLAKPLEFGLNFSYKEKILIVQGDFIVFLKSSCDRCLEKVEFKLPINIHEKLINELELSDFNYISEEQLEEEYKVYQGNYLDLTSIILENILISLPAKILCKTDCQGICPQCGKNLNTGDCNCVLDNIDPRLAELAKLKSSLEEV